MRITWICSLFAALSFVLSGCTADEDTVSYEEAEEHGAAEGEHGAHDHEHEHGPHEGHIIEIGEDHQLHAEIVFDAESRTITIYMLGEDVETAKPVPAGAVTLALKTDGEIQEIAATAAPQDGEEEGQASQFTISGDQLPESIQDEEDLQGEVVITIDGTAQRGPIEHDHEH